MTTRESAWSPEAEKGVLGAILIHPERFTGLAAVMRADEFFLPAHREIWDAMLALRERGQRPEITVVGDELRARGTAGKLDGGLNYLLLLTIDAPIPEYIGDRVGVVQKNAAVRALRAACVEISNMCQDDPENAAETLRKATRLVMDITLGRTSSTEDLEQLGHRVLDELARAERGEIVTRIPTGIAKLDRILLGGLAAGHLVVPCGLTSMGKSSWAFQVAFRGAEERQIPALIFTLEMSRAEAFVKGAATLSRVGTSAFAHPAHGTAVDWRTVNPAAARVAKLKDLVRIEEHRAIGQIVAVSTAWRAQHPGPAIIVVDLLQKVRGVRAKNANRQEEILGVAATLKDLAKDLGLAVVAPGQLDNDPAKEKRPPRIGDMRDSKAIEHEADVVIGIHRDRLVEAGSAELIVLKHRGGRVGKATVGWRGEWQGFENPEPGSDDGEDD